MKYILAAMMFSLAGVAHADDKPILSAKDGEALYQLGFAEGTAKAQMQVYQDNAKAAIDKINKDKQSQSGLSKKD